jgi:phospholipid/cholesterol/gamma-HCH transport system permease protein
MSLKSDLKSFLTLNGELFRFSQRFFRHGLNPPYEFSEFLKQCFVIGYSSMPLIGMTAFIMGLVLTTEAKKATQTISITTVNPL